MKLQPHGDNVQITWLKLEQFLNEMMHMLMRILENKIEAIWPNVYMQVISESQFESRSLHHTKKRYVYLQQ